MSWAVVGTRKTVTPDNEHCEPMFVMGPFPLFNIALHHMRSEEGKRGARHFSFSIVGCYDPRKEEEERVAIALKAWRRT